MRELEGAITEIVSMVCSTTLGLDVAPGGDYTPAPGERVMVGCVQITGAWSGAVLVSCRAEFARLAAKLIFGSNETLEEERDALGELSNMIAGNIKALLPGPSFLSLPTLSDGVDGVLQVLGSRLLEKFELSVAGEPLTVVVVKRVTTLPQGRA